MRRAFLILFLLTAVFFFIPPPEAKAVDPITISLLAPYAMAAASKAAPYVMRGLAGLGKGCVNIGVDIIDIFRIPLGVTQLTMLWPFGYFKDGIYNIVVGGIAPFKLCFHCMTLPLCAFGFGS